MFGAWIHIMVIRLFVESILRYGLPPSFVAGIMEARPKVEKKLRTILQTFGDDGRIFPRNVKVPDRGDVTV